MLATPPSLREQLWIVVQPDHKSTQDYHRYKKEGNVNAIQEMDSFVFEDPYLIGTWTENSVPAFGLSKLNLHEVVIDSRRDRLKYRKPGIHVSSSFCTSIGRAKINTSKKIAPNFGRIHTRKDGTLFCPSLFFDNYDMSRDRHLSFSKNSACMFPPDSNASTIIGTLLVRGVSVTEADKLWAESPKEWIKGMEMLEEEARTIHTQTYQKQYDKTFGRGGDISALVFDACGQSKVEDYLDQPNNINAPFCVSEGRMNIRGLLKLLHKKNPQKYKQYSKDLHMQEEGKVYPIPASFHDLCWDEVDAVVWRTITALVGVYDMKRFPKGDEKLQSKMSHLPWFNGDVSDLQAHFDQLCREGNDAIWTSKPNLQDEDPCKRGRFYQEVHDRLLDRANEKHPSFNQNYANMMKHFDNNGGGLRQALVSILDPANAAAFPCNVHDSYHGTFKPREIRSYVPILHAVFRMRAKLEDLKSLVRHEVVYDQQLTMNIDTFGDEMGNPYFTNPVTQRQFRESVQHRLTHLPKGMRIVERTRLPHWPRPGIKERVLVSDIKIKYNYTTKSRISERQQMEEDQREDDRDLFQNHQSFAHLCGDDAWICLTYRTLCATRDTASGAFRVTFEWRHTSYTSDFSSFDAHCDTAKQLVLYKMSLWSGASKAFADARLAMHLANFSARAWLRTTNGPKRMFTETVTSNPCRSPIKVYQFRGEELVLVKPPKFFPDGINPKHNPVEALKWAMKHGWGKTTMYKGKPFTTPPLNKVSTYMIQGYGEDDVIRTKDQNGKRCLGLRKGAKLGGFTWGGLYQTTGAWHTGSYGTLINMIIQSTIFKHMEWCWRWCPYRDSLELVPHFNPHGPGKKFYRNLYHELSMKAKPSASRTEYPPIGISCMKIEYLKCGFTGMFIFGKTKVVPLKGAIMSKWGTYAASKDLDPRNFGFEGQFTTDDKGRFRAGTRRRKAYHKWLARVLVRAYASLHQLVEYQRLPTFAAAYESAAFQIRKLLSPEYQKDKGVPWEPMHIAKIVKTSSLRTAWISRCIGESDKGLNSAYEAYYQTILESFYKDDMKKAWSLSSHLRGNLPISKVLRLPAGLRRKYRGKRRLRPNTRQRKRARNPKYREVGRSWLSRAVCKFIGKLMVAESAELYVRHENGDIGFIPSATAMWIERTYRQRKWASNHRSGRELTTETVQATHFYHNQCELITTVRGGCGGTPISEPGASSTWTIQSDWAGASTRLTNVAHAYGTLFIGKDIFDRNLRHDFEISANYPTMAPPRVA